MCRCVIVCSVSVNCSWCVRNPNSRDEDTLIPPTYVRISGRFQLPGGQQEAQDSDLGWSPRGWGWDTAHRAQQHLVAFDNKHLILTRGSTRSSGKLCPRCVSWHGELVGNSPRPLKKLEAKTGHCYFCPILLTKASQRRPN